MPIDLAADREARRKARYRGKPERARFHRPDSDKHFEIDVPRSEALCDRESDLVQGISSISIDAPAACGTCSDDTKHRKPSTMEDSDSGLGIDEADCLEDNEAHAATPGSPSAESAAISAWPEPASSHSANEPESGSIDSDDRPEPASINPAGEPEPVSIDTADEPEPRKSDKFQKKPKSRNQHTGKKSAQRPRAREGIDITGIEQVVEQVPERMTRSMARKIGVQRPRRHFGEGVSTSQILRPTSTKP